MTVIGIVLCVARAGASAWSPARMMLGKQESAVPEAERQKLVEAARAEAAELKRAAAARGQGGGAQGAPPRPSASSRSAAPSCRRAKRRCAAARRSWPRSRARSAAREAEFERKEKTVAGREQAAEATAKRAEELLNEAKQRLEKLAGMTAEEARKRAGGAGDRRGASSGRRRDQEDRGRGATPRPRRSRKRILGTAIQRYAGEYVTERTVSVVPLPSDDLKGRIIGREGRNIRALEAATGIDLIIDDTPEAVIISLLQPGAARDRQAGADAADRRRAHPPHAHRGGGGASAPTRSRRSARRPASRRCSISGCTRCIPSWCARSGGSSSARRTRRTCLQHSIEVGLLAGIMAGELGLNVKLARRAGLLARHRQERRPGGRGVARAGRRAAGARSSTSRRRCAPPSRSTTATSRRPSVLSTHRRRCQRAVGPAAGRAAGAARVVRHAARRSREAGRAASPACRRPTPSRPGARCACWSRTSQVSDEQSLLLAKDIAKRIEDEATYPGQVRVCVIRETRSTDYAK